MIYILVFMIFTNGRGSNGTATSITAEYNSRNACETAASDLYNQSKWANRVIWSCKPKGDK